MAAEQSQDSYAGAFPIGRFDRVREHDRQRSSLTTAINQSEVNAQLAKGGTNDRGCDTLEGGFREYLPEQAAPQLPWAVCCKVTSGTRVEMVRGVERTSTILSGER